MTTVQRLDLPVVGVPGLRLIRSEIRKIASTNAWWQFGIASLVVTGLTLWGNLAEGAGDLADARDTTRVFTPRPGMSPSEIAAAQQRFAEAHDIHQVTINTAANVFTSGQFFGMVLVMLLGALVMTNEFQYQTATATFLTTPHRTRVVIGKLVAGTGLAMVFWAFSQAISLTVGLIFFSNISVSNSLGEWTVQRAMLFNALGYLLWAVLGMGLGTMLRNQIGTVVTSLVIYLVGFAGGIAAVRLIYTYVIKQDWVLTWAVGIPPIASEIMISPDKPYPQAAAWWVGALVLAGWSLLLGGIGVFLTRRRDIA